MSASARVILLAGAALTALAGGGRLAWNEVRLASHETRLHEVDRRATEEAALAARLELELAESRGVARRAREAAEASAAAVTSLRAEMGRAEEELRRAEEQGQADARALTALAARRDELQRGLAAAEEESRAREQARAALAGRVSELEGELARQGQALARAREAVRAREAELTSATSELGQTRGRVEELSRLSEQARSELARRELLLSQRQEELEGARGELARLDERARLAQQQLEALRRAGINVDRLGGRRPLPALRAMLLRVDLQALPPEVLIDAGGEAGLEPGDRLWVMRDGREVARLEVHEVQRDAARARVVQGDRSAPPRPGDTVLSWKPGSPPP